jgi:hypothetical protein
VTVLRPFVRVVQARARLGARPASAPGRLAGLCGPLGPVVYGWSEQSVGPRRVTGSRSAVRSRLCDWNVNPPGKRPQRRSSRRNAPRVVHSHRKVAIERHARAGCDVLKFLARRFAQGVRTASGRWLLQLRFRDAATPRTGYLHNQSQLVDTIGKSSGARARQVLTCGHLVQYRQARTDARGATLEPPAPARSARGGQVSARERDPGVADRHGRDQDQRQDVLRDQARLKHVLGPHQVEHGVGLDPRGIRPQ